VQNQSLREELCALKQQERKQQPSMHPPILSGGNGGEQHSGAAAAANGMQQARMRKPAAPVKTAGADVQVGLLCAWVPALAACMAVEQHLADRSCADRYRRGSRAAQ
jgi:hypothetical protein